jgi:hypothetical protein
LCAGQRHPRLESSHESENRRGPDFDDQGEIFGKTNGGNRRESLRRRVARRRANPIRPNPGSMVARTPGPSGDRMKPTRAHEPSRRRTQSPARVDRAEQTQVPDGGGAEQSQPSRSGRPRAGRCRLTREAGPRWRRAGCAEQSQPGGSATKRSQFRKVGRRPGRGPRRRANPIRPRGARRVGRGQNVAQTATG